MPSNNLLTSPDPYQLAGRAFGFDWSRSVGKDGRWWNEEIYAGMSRGGVTWKKQSDPRELTTLVWMTLAHGAAGAMFWQHRPEYLSFESPGYNLVALDGEPTPRFEAVTRAIRADRRPQRAPAAGMSAAPTLGIVYHPESQELFGYNDEHANATWPTCWGSTGRSGRTASRPMSSPRPWTGRATGCCSCPT